MPETQAHGAGLWLASPIGMMQAGLFGVREDDQCGNVRVQCHRETARLQNLKEYMMDAIELLECAKININNAKKTHSDAFLELALIQINDAIKKLDTDETIE